MSCRKKTDDPYLRAQLYQAMDDKQQLYNLYQGKKNPFKTETSTETRSQTQPQKQSTASQSDVLVDMEKLKKMFRTPEETEKPEKATFQGYKKKSFPRPARPYSPPPSYHIQTPRSKSSPECIPRPKSTKAAGNRCERLV